MSPEEIQPRMKIQTLLSLAYGRSRAGGCSRRGAGASDEGADGVAEEVVGNAVGIGEEFDREAVGERDQGRGEVLRGDRGIGAPAAGGLKQAGDDGSEAGVALGEPL